MQYIYIYAQKINKSDIERAAFCPDCGVHLLTCAGEAQRGEERRRRRGEVKREEKTRNEREEMRREAKQNKEERDIYI